MSEQITIKSITDFEDLDLAYKGSFYTISGAGGPLEAWVNGIGELLESEDIGKVKQWYSTTGAAVNGYAALTSPIDAPDQFPLDLTILMFSLKGLDMGKLAIFKIKMEDRWFDDVIDNMRRN